MATHGVASDDKIIIMATFGFQCGGLSYSFHPPPLCVGRGGVVLHAYSIFCSVFLCGYIDGLVQERCNSIA